MRAVGSVRIRLGEYATDCVSHRAESRPYTVRQGSRLIMMSTLSTGSWNAYMGFRMAFLADHKRLAAIP